MELNGSSYYRSNPFHNQGGLPNSAFRNRLPPSSVAEVPQGNSYFDPTNKKHFQRLGYYSTIGEEHLINNSQIREGNRENPSSRGGPLSIEDIEGATTNTLISKAVKNRLKAQQELQRRKLDSSHGQQGYQSQPPQPMQKQALDRMRAAPQPNYHTLVKQLKTEESQGSPQRQPKQPYGGGESRRDQQMRPAVTQNMVPSQSMKRHDQYQQDLTSTEDEIRRLEQELKVLKQSRQKSRSQFEPPQQPPQLQYSHQQQPRLSQPRNYGPQHQHQYAEQEAYSQGYGEPPTYNAQPPHNYSQPQLHELPMPTEPKPTSPIDQYHQVYPRHPEPQQKPPNPHQPYHPHHQPYTQLPPSQPHHVQGYAPLEQSRQQHRRFNPTFLSYGSQPIGIAGKNIVAS